MPAPISMDLRLRIVGAVEGGSSIRGAARRLAISPSAAIKLMQRVRATGSASPARYGGHRRPLFEPGDVVVLDNLAAHNLDGIRHALAAAGASILHLPPYSPDLNPIERLFAKLWSAIGRLLETVPESECANYLHHCGYGAT